jgi:transcriptional regulator with XRE-family HTH domain
MNASNDVVAKKVRDAADAWRLVRRAEPTLQLRRAMRSKGLKNVDIAERLGISEANVSRWLRGNQNLTIDTLYALADSVESSLNISVGDVLHVAAVAPHSSMFDGAWRRQFVGANVVDLMDFKKKMTKPRPVNNFSDTEYACITVSR